MKTTTPVNVTENPGGPMPTYRYVDPAAIHAAAARGDQIYPYASWEPIPENDTQPSIVPASFILHTMAGPRSTDPDSLRAYMARGDVAGECHLVLGYSKLIQVIRFDVRADNNYKANSWFEGSTRYGAVSVETQDDGANNNVENDPWNEFQIEHLAGIAAHLALLDNTEVTLDRVTGDWQDRGVDGHRAWPEWSVYTGKSCPGDARWEQIPLILDLAAQIVAWTPDHTEDDMDTLAPRRLLDTRPASPKYKANAGTDHPVPIVEAKGYKCAQVTVTVVEPEAAGHLTAWRDGDRPNTSFLNYSAGQPPVTETLFVPVDANGTFRIWTLARVHLIIDFTGIVGR